MARKRQIDPDIWTSEQFINLSIEGRLLFIGMISMADDEGRLKGNPLILKANLYPADNHSIDKIRKWRDEVINQLLTSLYVVDGQEYLWLPTFKKYQYMTKRFPSKLPEFSYETGQVNNELLTGTQHSYEVGIGIEVGNEVEVGTGRKSGKELFELFWGEYPRKTGKGKARESFLKIKPSLELTDKIITAVQNQKKSQQWLREKGQFIPHPATWLNQERWDDEIEGTPVLPLPEKECEEI